jgi:hypothetical protein
MDLMNATMGDGSSSDGWRSFWEQTTGVDDDDSETGSVRSSHSSRHDQPMMRQAPSFPSRQPLKLRLPSVRDDRNDDLMSQDLNGMENSVLGSEVGSQFQLGGRDRRSPSNFDALFIFKIQDPNGNLHRVSASAERLDHLVGLLAVLFKASASHLRLTYKDEEGDDIMVSDDTSLSEAVDTARAQGENHVRLRAEIDETLTETDKTAATSPPNKAVAGNKIDAVAPPLLTPIGGQEPSSTSPQAQPPSPSSERPAASPAASPAAMSPLVLAGAAAALAGIIIAGIVTMKNRN